MKNNINDKKNNVIVILVDSVYSDCLGSNRTKISSTPFIDSLIKDNGLYVPNIYSYGPYTNAATKGIFCGTETLNDYGYYFGINSSKYNHYKIFKENGYETYGFYYPYYLIDSKNSKYIDNHIFTSGFVFSPIWRGNFEYYSIIKKSRELKDIEYLLMEKALKEIFDIWIGFYEILTNDSNSSRLLTNNIGKFDIQKAKRIVEEEKLLFKKEPIIYLNELLKCGMKHRLANIDKIDVSKFADKNFIQGNIYKKYNYVFREMNKINKKCNKQNNFIEKNRIIKSIKKFLRSRKIKDLRYIINIFLAKNSIKMMIKNTNKKIWQEMPSAHTMIDEMKITINKHIGRSEPFYMFCHLLDAHERISFFSYDSKSVSVIKNDIESAHELARNVGSDFKGSLLYQLSLNYIDNQLERLFKHLEVSNLLDNTTVMIVSDHGSSYTNYPIRENVVNNFHKENYNVPLLIWKKRETHGGINEHMYQSRDILPTLLSINNLNIPNGFTGKPLWEYNGGYEYVITEYMGPGCPDMLSKEIWMSIRDENYMISIKNKINMSFSNENICEIYDLKDDPLELKNLISSEIINLSKVKYLLDKLNERFDNIIVDRDRYISKIIKEERGK